MTQDNYIFCLKYLCIFSSLNSLFIYIYLVKFQKNLTKLLLSHLLIRLHDVLFLPILLLKLFAGKNMQIKSVTTVSSVFLFFRSFISCILQLLVGCGLTNFTKFTGKHLRQSLFFIKVETLAQVFSCEFCEISKNNFLHRTPLVAASEISLLNFANVK